MKLREATLEERFTWLDSHRNDLKGDLSHLEELVDKRLRNILESILRPLRGSQSYLKLNSKVKDREKELRGLESDSERLSDKVVRLERNIGKRHSFWSNKTGICGRFRFKIWIDVELQKICMKS